ncbi:MAG TPA: hypothetical protein VNT52_08650 [Acidimicrobiales bacterium]|nr:hypothetical protein [Acidimicrobiales bacterium]
MDWRKVDAPLASALAGVSPDEPLSVFVQIDRSRADVDGEVLDRLGLGRDAAGLATATLLPAQVDALTDEEWVLHVRLSGRLRLLRQPGELLTPAGEKQAGAGDQDRRPKQEKRKPRPS